MARQQLVSKIVECVFVYGSHIIAVVLHGRFAGLVEDKIKTPVELTDALTKSLNDKGISLGQSGADGVQPVLCIVLIPPIRAAWHGKRFVEFMAAKAKRKSA